MTNDLKSEEIEYEIGVLDREIERLAERIIEYTSPLPLMIAAHDFSKMRSTVGFFERDLAQFREANARRDGLVQALNIIK